jgi:hypothetical protein
MIPMMLVNHEVSTLGLKAMRTTRLTAAAGVPSVREKIADFGIDDPLRVIRPETGLYHCSRIDIELDRRLAAGENVAREIRRNVEHEGVSSAVHFWDDVAFGNELRRLKVGPQKGVRDTARQFRMALVDDRDRGVVHFLGAALRLRYDSKRKCIDDEAEQHEIAHKSSQFLGAEPKNVGQAAQQPATFVLSVARDNPAITFDLVSVAHSNLTSGFCWVAVTASSAERP